MTQRRVAATLGEAVRQIRNGNLRQAVALLPRLFGNVRMTPTAPPSPGPVPAARPVPVAELPPIPLMAPPEPQPLVGTFLAASHSEPAGSRDFKLYVPAAAAEGPRPLVVMLHGCTQSPDDFAAGTRMNLLAEEEGLLVAYPAQAEAANATRCWNWFNPPDQQREGGEPSIIAGIVRRVIREHGADPHRVFVAGLSAGGAEAAILGATHPDLFAGVGVHSGLARGAASGIPSAFAAMRRGGPVPEPAGVANGRARLVPAIVFHGDADATVNPLNGERVIEQFMAVEGAELRTAVEPGQAPGGRPYTRTRHTDTAGRTLLEHWVVHGLGHGWSGGSPDGSYTDPLGPDASQEMLRFFLAHPHPAPAVE